MKHLLILSLLIFTSCASLNSVSLTQVPSDRSHPIEAEASSWAILGMHLSNGWVDDAIQGLRQKCSDGKVSGVYTKYEGRNYFFWTTRTVKAHAYCQKGTRT